MSKKQAKPILVIYAKWFDGLQEVSGKICKELTAQFDYQYHVIVVVDRACLLTRMECLNDYKGLKDVDIEALIDKYNTHD